MEACRQDRLKIIERQKEEILEGKRLKKRKLNERNAEVSAFVIYGKKKKKTRGANERVRMRY